MVVLHGTGWARQWKEGWRSWELLAFSLGQPSQPGGKLWEGLWEGFVLEGLLQILLRTFSSYSPFPLYLLCTLHLESLLIACSNGRPLQDLGGMLPSTVVPFSSGKKMGCECPESAVRQVLQPRSVEPPLCVVASPPLPISPASSCREQL